MSFFIYTSKKEKGPCFYLVNIVCREKKVTVVISILCHALLIVINFHIDWFSSIMLRWCCWKRFKKILYLKERSSGLLNVQDTFFLCSFCASFVKFLLHNLPHNHILARMNSFLMPYKVTFSRKLMKTLRTLNHIHRYMIWLHSVSWIVWPIWTGFWWVKMVSEKGSSSLNTWSNRFLV